MAQARRTQERGVSLTSPGIFKSPGRLSKRASRDLRPTTAAVPSCGASGARAISGAQSSFQLQSRWFCLPGVMPRPSLPPRAKAPAGVGSGGSAALQVEGIDRALARATSVHSFRGKRNIIREQGGASSWSFPSEASPHRRRKIQRAVDHPYPFKKCEETPNGNLLTIVSFLRTREL